MYKEHVSLDALILEINKNSFDCETIRLLFSKLDRDDMEYAQAFRYQVKDAQRGGGLLQDRNATKIALQKLMDWNEKHRGVERSKRLQQIMQEAVQAIETEQEDDSLESKKIHLFSEYVNWMDVLLAERENRNEEELS